MADEDLWALIERTRPGDGNRRDHAEAIVEALVAAGPEAAVRLTVAFDEALDALYTWDLWGTAFLLHGGCSDDAFEYHRCWIIGEGRDRWLEAQRDPEQMMVDLFAGTERDEGLVIERIEDLWNLDGEPLLYAPQQALEQLGVRPPAHRRPAEPEGEPWEEDDLPRRFPLLAAALPPDWYEDLREADAYSGEAQMQIGISVQGPFLEVVQAVADGLGAFADGDHDRSRSLLDPVVDDPERWALVGATGNDPVAVAYAAGMSRFIAGDPDGAARALALVASGDATPAHVRRGMAQVHLARGDLDGAALLLDGRRRAEPMDQALRATLLLRQGEKRAAAKQAKRVLLLRRVPLGAGQHPWELAGMLLQAGLVLVELGDAERALQAADSVDHLVADGPPELPLRAQATLLRAGGLRLEGDLLGASALLRQLTERLDAGTCDLGLVQREQARGLRAADDDEAASERYAAAEATLRAAGERWLADEVAREAAD